MTEIAKEDREQFLAAVHIGVLTVADVGAVAELGDGADGEGGHDQYGVSADRGVEAGLALVESELVLAELEIFLDGPP